jgi:hypothetical protein
MKQIWEMPHICGQSLVSRDVLSFESKSKSKWHVMVDVMVDLMVGPQSLTNKMTIFVIFQIECYLRHYLVFIGIL